MFCLRCALIDDISTLYDERLPAPLAMACFELIEDISNDNYIGNEVHNFLR